MAESGWKWASYAWSIFIELVVLVIALILLSRFASPFDRIVIDVLVLIYVAVGSVDLRNRMLILDQAKIAQARYVELMRHLGSAEFKGEGMNETLKNDQEKIQRYNAEMGIHATGSFLVFCAAVWNLVGDLMN